MARQTATNRDFNVFYTNRQVTMALSIGGVNAFNDGLHQMSTKMSLVFKELSKAIDVKAIPKSRYERVNLRLAEGAQKVMVSGWRSRLPRNSSAYRPHSRLTGVLGPALASPEMLNGTTANSISFLNGSFLSTHAVHWYRVNYGAFGPNLARGEKPGSFSVKLTKSGNNVMVLRDRARPAPHSWLPVAFKWINSESDTGTPGSNLGGNIFKPTKGPAIRVGAGVRAARFTDLGLQFVAQRFGPYYEDMFIEYGRSKVGEARLARFNLKVPANVRMRRNT